MSAQAHVPANDVAEEGAGDDKVLMLEGYEEEEVEEVMFVDEEETDEAGDNRQLEATEEGSHRQKDSITCCLNLDSIVGVEARKQRNATEEVTGESCRKKIELQEKRGCNMAATAPEEREQQSAGGAGKATRYITRWIALQASIASKYAWQSFLQAAHPLSGALIYGLETMMGESCFEPATTAIVDH